MLTRLTMTAFRSFLSVNEAQSDSWRIKTLKGLSLRGLLNECYSCELHKRSVSLWALSLDDKGRVLKVLNLALSWIRLNNGKLLKKTASESDSTAPRLDVAELMSRPRGDNVGALASWRQKVNLVSHRIEDAFHREFQRVETMVYVYGEKQTVVSYVEVCRMSMSHIKISR